MPALPPQFSEAPIKINKSTVVKAEFLEEPEKDFIGSIKNEDTLKLGKLKPLNPVQGVHGLSLPLLSALAFMLLPLLTVFALVPLVEPTVWQNFKYLNLAVYGAIFVASIWWVANLTKSIWNIIVYRSKLAGIALFFTLLTPIFWVLAWLAVGQNILSPVLEVM